MRYVLSLVTVLALSAGARACDFVVVPFVQPFVSVQAFSVPVVSSFAFSQTVIFQQRFSNFAIVQPAVSVRSRTVVRQGLLGRQVIRSRTVIR